MTDPIEHARAKIKVFLGWVKESNSIEVCCVDCSGYFNMQVPNVPTKWVGGLPDGRWKCTKCGGVTND